MAKRSRAAKLTTEEQLRCPCPTCHAPAGDRCRNWRGQAMACHRDRGHEKAPAQLTLFAPDRERGGAP